MATDDKAMPDAENHGYSNRQVDVPEAEYSPEKKDSRTPLSFQFFKPPARASGFRRNQR